MTMQNVACPTMIVQSPKVDCQNEKNELNAMPVMIPGNAIGRTKRNEIVSRPKNRNLWTANAAADPSKRAITVAPSAALTDRSSACCISASWVGGANHFVVQSVIGHPCAVCALNA